MANFNRVILAGNLTRDPQLSMLPSNNSVCEFGMAINRKWKDQRTNEMREEVCFVDVRAFGRQADTINQYFKKGKPILIEGSLRFDQWEAKDGSGKRSKLYVVLDRFTFIESGGAGGGGRGTRSSDSQEMPPIDSEMAASDAMRAPSGDDIPF